MLTQICSPERLQEILVPREQWEPIPRAADRAAWTGLPDPVRRAHVKRGEQVLNDSWEVLPATLFMEFARNGNRSHYQQARSKRRTRLADLVIAESVENQGRFVDAIVDGIWLTCEETYWGVPAHINMQAAGRGLPDAAEPTVDLFAGETVSLLAWALYLLGPQLEKVSSLIPARIQLETQRRVLTPCLERDDFWWMGFGDRRVNNWNPWCNSNWLTAALLLERDPQRRVAAVAKSLRSLDRFIDPYPRDGGCDEGPGYWGRAAASLFDCLELLHSATGGALDVYGEPLVQEMGRYIYRVQIADRYFVNFADAPALVVPNAGVTYRYGKRIGDPQMQTLGAWAAQQQGIMERGAGDSLGRQLPLLFTLDQINRQTSGTPLPRDAWFPEIQVMTARDTGGSSAGLYVAAKGGHNQESHNHNDVGHFVVYVDGRPVLVDVGVETYSAKTFGRQRYDIWTMQSAYHNLPTVEGNMQQPGAGHAARSVHHSADDTGASLELDLAGAYSEDAGIASWQRTVKLERGQAVEVTDVFELQDVPDSLTLSLMTPCQVTAQPGRLVLTPRKLAGGRQSGSAVIQLPGGLAASVEAVELQDSRLRGVWGERLFRILLAAEKPAARGAWTLRIVQGREE